MKRKELTREYIINGWLQKYHGITVEKLIEKEPELAKTIAWYDKYKVTSEQHDEWYAWAIDEICKVHKYSKKQARRLFVIDYFNVAPSIKQSKLSIN